MAGRGDKNKAGSSGQGSSNQSNQAQRTDQQKSNSGRTAKGNWPSEPQQKRQDPDANRGTSTTPELEIKPLHGSPRNFNLVLDSVPYLVKATPFTFNGEMRYTVTLNGGAEHIFTWDSDLKRLKAIDDDASILPEGVEEAISEKLQSRG
jgi:hypothetical protein